jgi:tetratricopeptide (TPR) repeat protein
MKCSKCGLESDVKEAFVVRAQKSGSERKCYCPDCWEKRSRSESLRSNLWTLLIVVVAAVGLSGSRLGLMLTNLILMLVLSLLLSAMHELAHAATGRLFGIRIFRIAVGGGITLLSWRMFGILWELRLSPVGGATWLASPPQRMRRLRLSGVILAGPLMNAALLAVGILAVIHLINLHPVYGTKAASYLNLGLLFVFCNLIFFVSSILPFLPATSKGQSATTDGWKLLQIIFGKQDDPETVETHYYIQEYLDALQRNDPGAAMGWAERGLRRFPEHPTLRDMLGNSLARARRFRDAREVFLSLLSSEEAQKPLFKYIICNNLAYADLLLRDPDLLPEAERYSGDAYRQIRWLPEIVGTRGAVLVELGRLDEGVRLLREAMGKLKDAPSRAVNACHLAVAEHRAGHAAESRRYYQLAWKLDPKCYLLEQTARMVGAG